MNLFRAVAMPPRETNIIAGVKDVSRRGCLSKIAMDSNLSARKLDKMIEEATVDCYDELEQASGFYTMIEDHLAVPFATRALGAEVLPWLTLRCTITEASKQCANATANGNSSG